MNLNLQKMSIGTPLCNIQITFNQNEYQKTGELLISGLD